MTTLAIIGSGILGRSLIYTLAKEQKRFEKITLFYSDTFAFPCTFHSTAVVAPRGLTAGHSELGNLLLESFKVFSDHVELDCPEGIQKIIQYTGATTRLEEFKLRYLHGKMSKKFLYDDTYLAEDVAYLIDPRSYCNWLLKEAMMMQQDHLEVLNDFVTEVKDNDRIHLKTHNGKNLSFDKVVFAGGNYNRFWSELAPDSRLKTSKPSQGCYLEYNDVDWTMPSFSLTLDGDNLIWNEPLKRLLIGSTTLETNHELPPMDELKRIVLRLSERVDLNIPMNGEVRVGLREKAQKRSPYLIGEGNKIFAGGLYKNGFSLSLKMSRNLSHQHL